MSHSIESCVLCGNDAGDRVMALVEWIEPIGKESWSNVPRCVDRLACRERVEVVLREPWPINDRTPAPVHVPAVEEAVAPAPAEPEAVDETPEPHGAEEIAWLR